MEISVRDWMIIIGVLLIVAVLLDGYRRARDPRRIRMSLSRVPDDGDDTQDVSVMRELPNGGARVKPRAGDPGGAESNAPASTAASPATTDEPGGDGSGGDGSAKDGPGHKVKVKVKVENETDGDSGDAAPPGDRPQADIQRDAAQPPASKSAGRGEPPLLTEPASEKSAVKPDGAAAEPDPLMDAAPVPAGANMDLLEGITADSRQELAVERDGQRASDGEQAQEVIMLHVVSRQPASFSGDDILQVLLAYDLRFGELNFFHRHEEAAGRGPIQFSVANMLQPGIFDIDAMSNFQTTGLIFFLTLPGPRDMMASFELMLETAQGVAEHLGGDLLDESRSVTTRQTLEHMRQRIRELERKLLARDKR